MFMVRVLFVCLGNICRSPIAQGVFEEVVRREGLEGEIEADSCGTHSYNLGKAPDERAQKSATRRGIDISSQRARRLTPEDCRGFDYILVMDKKNRRRVKRLCKGVAAEVRLFLDYAPELPEREVPDPYHGGPEGFEVVMDLVQAASEGFVKDIRRRHLLHLSGRSPLPTSRSRSTPTVLPPGPTSGSARLWTLGFRLWRTCAAKWRR
jgi:low molecular weight protein-tyrosine phosphatase